MFLCRGCFVRQNRRQNYTFSFSFCFTSAAPAAAALCKRERTMRMNEQIINNLRDKIIENATFVYFIWQFEFVNNGNLICMNIYINVYICSAILVSHTHLLQLLIQFLGAVVFGVFQYHFLRFDGQWYRRHVLFCVFIVVVVILVARTLNCNCVRRTVKKGHVFHLHSLSISSFFLNFRFAIFIYFSVFVAVLLLPLLVAFHLVTHTHIYAKSIVDFAHYMCVCMCVSSSALSAGLLSASSAAFSCFCV